MASIDAHGVLTPFAQGVVVVSATAKGAVASRSVDVVAAVAGNWTLSFIGTLCDDDWDTGCLAGRPWPTDGAKVTLTQIGSHVDGTWTGGRYPTGFPPTTPFAGRISTDGTIDLAAAYCSLDDVNHGTKYTLRDWHMGRAADGSYSGRVTWEQGDSPHYRNGCEGEPLHRIVEDLIVTNFRRSD